MSRWRRRLVWWARQNRVGLWVVALLAMLALAYGLVVLTDAARTYVFPGYEPKDMQREQFLEREQRGGRDPGR